MNTKIAKEKVCEIVQETVFCMEDRTVEELENLYFILIGQLSGTPAEDLWERFQVLYDTDKYTEIAAVDAVGRELGYPEMWDMLAGTVAYLAENRTEPGNEREA